MKLDLTGSVIALARLGAGALLGLALTSGAAEAPPPPAQAEQAALRPAQALQRLVDGNARFVAGRPHVRDWPMLRSQTAAAQYPFAVVLGCIDSRVSAELVFDQGLGDIFNARVAGNVIDADVLGGMEFACKVAGAKLIFVVGHSGCGAVKGACTGAELGHLTGLLAKIRPAVVAARMKFPELPPGDATFVDTVAELNVRGMMRQIREQSAVLREMIDAGTVALAGGFHHLGTGKVTVLGN